MDCRRLAYLSACGVGTTTNMTLVSDSNIKHWSLSANCSLAHCQMLHIAIVVVVEALGLSKCFVTYKLNNKEQGSQ